jgi:heme exporter protein A
VSDPGAAGEPPLLLMAGVTAARGGRILFERMDIVLRAGEAMVVAGPNGSGKSSMLRVAAGLLRPVAGNVERGRTALADEQLALEPRRTLAAALGFWAALDGVDAATAMAKMGLERLSGVPVRMLSTGQRKRAALARVIASGAPLWLLDEPANGLDRDGQERLAAAMAEHREAGGAIMAATHQPFGLGQAHEVWLG